MKDVSLLKQFSPHSLGEGVRSRPSESIVLEGTPQFTAWPNQDEPVQVGVWAATPGLHRVKRDATTWEQFYLLEGEIEITEEGHRPRRFTAGDVVIIEPNFRGTWRTIAPVKKLYVSVQL